MKHKVRRDGGPLERLVVGTAERQVVALPLLKRRVDSLQDSTLPLSLARVTMESKEFVLPFWCFHNAVLSDDILNGTGRKGEDFFSCKFNVLYLT